MFLAIENDIIDTSHTRTGWIMMRLKKQENKYISVYGEIARVLSESEDVEKIYDLLKGQTISFPKKLYSTEYIKEYIHKNYGKETGRDIACKFGITDRRVRQIAKEKEQKSC